jgi:hypothetical protein
MQKLGFVIVLSLFSITSIAQTTNEDITTSFFKEFAKDPLNAYTHVLEQNKWIADKKSTIETNKIKLKDLLDQLGDYDGYELITEKKAGESYILKSFLIKYERQPIRFTFILYKPKQSWELQNFNFDTDIDTELSDAAKVDRLKENW